ncbi:DMT family transporter [Rhodosalinus sediminis]|jgi:drug/metabolite transporter (DMT)-like permease|uniref:DMT family transporter n=1 Tax=Rhodosalinus sediminis TaxID=1940533 RepID=UPI002354C0DA|nr:DMT family transporter [Rhodosalinus sediminis]
MAEPRADTRPLAGALWMLAAGLCFVAVTALVKYLGDRVPAPQSAFLRYLLGLVFLLPALRPLLRARPTRRQHLLFGVRGLFHAMGVMLWFYAMTRIPLAEVTAMNYLSPVYVTVGAALFLGERLALRRIGAVAVALAGAMVILRPGFRELDPGHLAMLGTAAIFGASYLLGKVVSDETDPALVVAMLSVWVTVGLVPFAAAVWIAPTLAELGVLLAVAFFATGGHYAMSLAFRAAPVTVTQPVTFLQLVWAVILGAAVFGEAIDPFVVTGGLIIIGAVSFITWREAMLKRRAITPAGPETKG